jgi:hypothetical protein
MVYPFDILRVPTLPKPKPLTIGRGVNHRVGQFADEYLAMLASLKPGGDEPARQLFHKFVFPRFNDHFLSGVGKDGWFWAIEAAALESRTEALYLFRESKRFLAQAVKQKKLKRNPLAGQTPITLSIHDSYYLDAEFIRAEDLYAIHQSSRQLEPPWRDIIMLSLLTGESVPDASRVSDKAVDWAHRVWTVEWHDTNCHFDYPSWDRIPRPSTPLRTVELSAEALEVLTPYREARGRFFTEFDWAVFRGLTDVRGACEWSARDVKRAVRRELRRFGKRPDALSSWAQALTNGVNASARSEQPFCAVTPVPTRPESLEGGTAGHGA